MPHYRWLRWPVGSREMSVSVSRRLGRRNWSGMDGERGSGARERSLPGAPPIRPVRVGAAPRRGAIAAGLSSSPSPHCLRSDSRGTGRCTDSGDVKRRRLGTLQRCSPRDPQRRRRRRAQSPSTGLRMALISSIPFICSLCLPPALPGMCARMSDWPERRARSRAPRSGSVICIYLSCRTLELRGRVHARVSSGLRISISYISPGRAPPVCPCVHEGLEASTCVLGAHGPEQRTQTGLRCPPCQCHEGWPS